jgi:hypothetical protein
MQHWVANDPMGPKRAWAAVFNLRREPSEAQARELAGAVVHGFITEAEVLKATKVSAPELEAAIESYRRALEHA